MTHGGWSPTERPTLAALLGGLRAGMDPTQAYSVLSDVLAGHESRRREDLARAEAEQERQRQEQEELEAEREEEEARRQELLGQLGQLVLERAGEGATPESLQTTLDVIGPTLGVTPQMTGQLEQAIGRAYPRPQYVGDPKITGGGMQQQTMIQGARPEISPLYQPPEQEAVELPELRGIKIPTTDPTTGLTGSTTLQNEVAAKVTEGIQAGASLEEIVGKMTASAVRQGYPPDVVAAVQEQVVYMYQSLAQQQPRPAPGPRAPAARPTAPPTNSQALATGAINRFFG
jgi:hypothetical protein